MTPQIPVADARKEKAVLADLLHRFRLLFVRLLAIIWRDKRWLMTSVIFYDGVAASARIGSVLLIAAAAGLFSEGGRAVFFGVPIATGLSFQVIAAFGAAIGLTTLAGALAGYHSARKSRQLGRWMNVRAMSDIHDLVSLSPQKLASARFSNTGDLNVVLTQVPIHTGLASETIARLVQPLFMMLFSGLVLLYQQPLFTLAAGVIALFFVPVLVRTSLKVQRNARSFYSEKALDLGLAVTSSIASVTGQHGIIPKTANITEGAQVREFFDSYDVNLLGNERVGLVVALADALLRPVLFVVLCTLVFLGDFSISAAIGFLGSLAYLLAAARTVASLATNMLRYHPQVDRYFNYLDSGAGGGFAETDNAGPPQAISFETLDASGETRGECEICLGETTLLLSIKPLSALTLGEILPPLFGPDPDGKTLASMSFVSGLFRYAPVRVLDQLCGAHPEAEAKARRLCGELGATECLESLPQGFDTQLSEDIWNRLDAASRVAIRLVPLCLDERPRITIIDVGVIQALGEKTWPLIRSQFVNAHLLLLVVAGATCPDFPAEHFLFLPPGEAPREGSRDWFRASLKNLPGITALDRTMDVSSTIL